MNPARPSILAGVIMRNNARADLGRERLVPVPAEPAGALLPVDLEQREGSLPASLGRWFERHQVRVPWHR